MNSTEPRKIISHIFYGKHIAMACKELISEYIWFSVSAYGQEYFRKGKPTTSAKIEMKTGIDSIKDEFMINAIIKKY